MPRAVISILTRAVLPCRWTASAKSIYRATYTHSTNLGKFVLIYKTLMLAQRKLSGKELSHHAFLAGLIGGYIVFGDGNNNVSYQVRE